MAAGKMAAVSLGGVARAVEAVRKVDSWVDVTEASMVAARRVAVERVVGARVVE